MQKLPRQKYTKEFKEEAVGMMNREQLSLSEAAKRLQIPDQTLANWARKYGENGEIAVRKTKKVMKELEAENLRLKKELMEARMEREILKKATAYFAKESQRGTHS